LIPLAQLNALSGVVEEVDQNISYLEDQQKDVDVMKSHDQVSREFCSSADIHFSDM
jgi:hypothetical protein